MYVTKDKQFVGTEAYFRSLRTGALFVISCGCLHHHKVCAVATECWLGRKQHAVQISPRTTV